MSSVPSESATAGPLQLHATTVASGPFAALLRGPSGIGKSDLALRFLAMPDNVPGVEARSRGLVADDQTLIRRSGATLEVSCPPSIAGRIEVRGLGIIRVSEVPRAHLALIVDLVGKDAIARLPEPLHEDVLGLPVRRIALWPLEASAPLKLALALEIAIRALTPKS